MPNTKKKLLLELEESQQECRFLKKKLERVLRALPKDHPLNNLTFKNGKAS